MWVTRYKVHCGREPLKGKYYTAGGWQNDFLAWSLGWSLKSKAFYGGHSKGCATIFVSKTQANGAIKQHKKLLGSAARGCKYTIHKVKVQVKKEKK